MTALDLFDGDQAEHDHDLQQVMAAGGYRLIAADGSELWGFPCRKDAVTEGCTPAWEPHPDCWFVWLYVGNLYSLIGMIPHPMPWVMFARRHQQGCVDNRLRAYKLEPLLERIINRSTPK
jgi:hypothetical protein